MGLEKPGPGHWSGGLRFPIPLGAAQLSVPAPTVSVTAKLGSMAEGWGSGGPHPKGPSQLCLFESRGAGAWPMGQGPLLPHAPWHSGLVESPTWLSLSFCLPVSAKLGTAWVGGGPYPTGPAPQPQVSTAGRTLLSHPPVTA